MADSTDPLTAQVVLSLMRPPEPNLSMGVKGRNAKALDWLNRFMGLAPDPALNSRSLMLWGEPGAGKSFWLKAWASEASDRSIYIDAQNPSALSEVASSKRAQTPGIVWLIDDIDRATSDAQALFFALYVELSELQQKIVATAQAAPVQLTGRLREDLRTRLGQGHVFVIHELTDEEKLQALRERACGLGWMPRAEQTDYDHVFQYMLARLPRDLSRLMAILHALDKFALSQKKPVSIALMRRFLEDNLALF